jgi:ATP-binding cassette subfamily F protein 3
MISHDREFLDSVSTHSALIHRGRLRKIQGSTEKLYAQIVLEEEVHERTRQNAEKKRLKEEAFITRFRAKASKASAVQSRIKRLEKMPALEKLAHIDELDFSFREAPFFAERMMELRGISFGYQEDAPLFQGLNLKIGPEDRIGVIGKNGKGKSTLLNLMAGELAPLKGERVLHPEVKLGYFGQTNIQRLQPQLTVEAEVNSANPDLGRTVVRTICGTMMFSGDAAEKKISVLSGGEKSRVLLGKILARPSNLLILDEPTNHLDMESIEALLESLGEFSGAVVIVTHSEMILKDVITKLVVFHRGGVEVFSGGYEEFLEKVGWEDEGPPKQSKPVAPVEKKSPLNKKERRRQRAELIAKRSRVLTPLKKEMEALEVSIATWETALTQAQADLLKASEEKATASLIEATQTVKDLEEKIESAFTHLSALNEQHESQSKEFTDLLEELS